MRVVKNHGLAGGNISESTPPVKPPVIHVACDADKSCDYAKYGIATEHGPLYLCGHHYHVNEKYITDKDYKVEELNA